MDWLFTEFGRFDAGVHITNWVPGGNVSVRGVATTHLAVQVSFQWKNPDFLLKNPDFLIRNPDFLLKNVDVL